MDSPSMNFTSLPRTRTVDSSIGGSYFPRNRSASAAGALVLGLILATGVALPAADVSLLGFVAVAPSLPFPLQAVTRIDKQRNVVTNMVFDFFCILFSSL